MTSDQDTAERLLAGRYRLTSVLGRGGMGTVWRAVDEVLGRAVAVKELRFAIGMDEDERRRLIARTLTEAKAIARVRHTAAITVYDVVEEDNRPWIVMELVESRSLSEVIGAEGVLPPRRAAEIGLELLAVLSQAHRSGILHRDVKPSNVLIGHDGRVVLTDFGIARVEGDPSVTSTGMLVGAPSYISPERARGRIPGAPSDLWSLGATLYAMVQGHPPYDKGSALSTLTAVMTEELVPPSNGGSLTPVIAGLLRKDPLERFDERTTRVMLLRVLAEPESEPESEPEAEAGSGPGARPGPEPLFEQPVPAALPEPVFASPVAAERTSTEPFPGSLPTQGSVATFAAGAGRGGRRAARLLVALLVLLLVAGGGVWVAMAQQGSKSPGKPGVSATARHKDGARASASSSASRASGTASGTSGSSTATTGTVAADSDFQRVGGPGGSSVEIPKGWTKTRVSAERWKYHGPAGTLVLDWTSTPGHSAVGAWITEEGQISGSFADYHQILLQTVSYRDGWDAADWEWTYTDGSGHALRAIDRGFVPDSHDGYAIYWTAAASSWDGARNQQLLARFFSSFQPAS